MSYSTLKKSLQLFEESADGKKSILNRTSNVMYFIYFLYVCYVLNIYFLAKKTKSKSQRAKSVFKIPSYIKSDASKSVQKIKEQIKNEKELNLVQLNLERLHKLDKTSYVNNIASTIVCTFLNHKS